MGQLGEVSRRSLSAKSSGEIFVGIFHNDTAAGHTVAKSERHSGNEPLQAHETAVTGPDERRRQRYLRVLSTPSRFPWSASDIVAPSGSRPGVDP